MSEKDDGLPRSSESTPSIGTLVGQLSEQVSRLVRAEIASAKAEMAQKAQKAGIGIGLLVVAGIASLYGLGFLLHSAMSGLDNVMPLWLAALIVGLVLVIFAGIVAAVGAKLLKKASPPSPEITVKSLRDDVTAIKEGIKS
ncbi:phage holin family protein [Sanguibacter suarezii]|uniref:phage holin family protein n=1 Tax=Sanguibacter suarezii TaxID=60921 RepID=UPI00082B3954|nr:phage holin family protein [Sanguibacter suarezii]